MKKMLCCTLTLMLAIGICYAQNFKATQKSQEKVIKSAYKSKKITELEYEKLMKEQQTIKETIEKLEADGKLDSDDKNAIQGKLDRAERRLKRYKTNRERY